MTGAEDRAALTERLAAAISYCEREIASMNASVRPLEKAERQRIENAYDAGEHWAAWRQTISSEWRMRLLC